MDRILCVVQEWTDDPRRGADGTAHKMNWTKPLGHGGPPLEDWKVSWRGWQVRLASETLSESPRCVATTTLSPSLPGFRTPSDGDLPEVQGPGDARAACRRGSPRCTSRRKVPYVLAYGGRAASDASSGSLKGCRVRITTKRPWWHCGQHAMSMPVSRCITVAVDSRGSTGGVGCFNRRRHVASLGVRQRLPTTP